MILADTSIWIDHLRSGDAGLTALLDAGGVMTHPFVIGELALGNIRQRKVILEALGDLPQAVAASHEEVLRFINEYSLYGLGVGYVDVHLIAAVLLTQGGRLWTRDKRLEKIATEFGVAHADSKSA